MGHHRKRGGLAASLTLAHGGMDKWPGPVDAVLTAQITRLKAYVETGKPN